MDPGFGTSEGIHGKKEEISVVVGDRILTNRTKKTIWISLVSLAFEQTWN